MPCARPWPTASIATATKVICQDSSVPSWGVYSATLPFGGTEGLKVNVSECSVEAAAQTLEDAGITDGDGDGVRELNGKPIEINLYTCTNYERFTQLADDMQSKLGQAGIKLNIVPIDYFIEDAETFAKDDPDMVFSYGHGSYWGCCGRQTVLRHRCLEQPRKVLESAG